MQIRKTYLQRIYTYLLVFDFFCNVSTMYLHVSTKFFAMYMQCICNGMSRTKTRICSSSAPPPNVSTLYLRVSTKITVDTKNVSTCVCNFLGRSSKRMSFHLRTAFVEAKTIKHIFAPISLNRKPSL